jgi:aspartyl-tRNA(Asn)/glutamyl-tRNA(Gln) amidotransferase subunit A
MYRKTRGAGFGDEVKRRVCSGRMCCRRAITIPLLEGQKVRGLIAKDFRDAFEKVDAIVTPPHQCRRFGWASAQDPLQMYLADIYTLRIFGGVPGISVPCGKVCGKLSVGLQILERRLPKRGCCNSRMPLSKLAARAFNHAADSFALLKYHGRHCRTAMRYEFAVAQRHIGRK